MNLRKRTAELLEPDRQWDGLSRILNLLLILLISLNVIAIIFESVDSIFVRFAREFRYFEVFSVAIFTVEYLARVWCSIDLKATSDSSPVIGRLKYMLTPLALVDLAAILPFYLSLYVSIDLRFLRGLRLLRLFKLSRYSPALGALFDVVQKEAEAIMAALVVLVILLIMSATGIHILEHELQPETFGSIPNSMWWAIVTLTTVGYGDIVPLTPMGKLFGGLIGLLGIGMIALPAAILASGFVDNIHDRRQKYNLHAERAMRDGVIDEQDRWELEKLRKELGLDSDEALQLLHAIMERSRHPEVDRCPHCGKSI
jgi:voltage-gated potassium channel